MAIWKVLLVVLFGGSCLALALATVAVPLAVEEHRWLWCGGLFGATVLVGTLFTVYLRYEDARPAPRRH